MGVLFCKVYQRSLGTGNGTESSMTKFASSVLLVKISLVKKKKEKEKKRKKRKEKTLNRSGKYMHQQKQKLC